MERFTLLQSHTLGHRKKRQKLVNSVEGADGLNQIQKKDGGIILHWKNNDYFLLLLVNSIEGAESADVKNQPQRKDGGIICTENNNDYSYNVISEQCRRSWWAESTSKKG